MLRRPANPLEGKAERPVVLITGSTDGLGQEVAFRVAALGAQVLVHGRDRRRGEEVVAAIEERGGGASFHPADLASLDEVRSLARAVLEEHERLDVLVLNAGIFLPERRESAEGHELHFAVNYLSHFLLTHELLPRLLDSTPSRIVHVASGAQSALDFDDVMLERGFDDTRGYAQSKLAQILHTVDLAQELADTDVTAVALHPATYMDTTMVRARGIRPLSGVDEGADAVLHLITGSRVKSGRYFEGRRPARPHPQASDAEARRRLHTLSRELTGSG